MSAAPAVDGTADSARVEDRLRARAAFYRNIIEGAADVTTLVAPDGTILYASAALSEPTSLGYTPQEVIGRNSLDLFHPDDRQGVQQAIASELAGARTTVEARVLRRDGSWMWVEMRGKGMIRLDGKAVVVAHPRDISARKRLERRLKKSEEYYQSLLHGASDLITVTDRSGAVRFASDSIERILGYRPDESQRERKYSRLSMKKTSRWPWNGSAKPLTLPTCFSNSCVRRKDSTVVCMRGYQQDHKRKPDGEPLVLINARDISERWRTEREHALLAAIVEILRRCDREQIL